MVQCAMCDSPAKAVYNVSGYGHISVCWKHYQDLHDNEKMKRKNQNKEFRDILKKIIHELNQHYVKIPLVQAPTRKFENNGRRWGLKIAITEIEKELEELIRE